LELYRSAELPVKQEQVQTALEALIVAPFRKRAGGRRALEAPSIEGVGYVIPEKDNNFKLPFLPGTILSRSPGFG